MAHFGIGIRGKILGFFGMTLAVVIAVEVLAQGAAVRAGLEFEGRLERYHSIQGLRAAFGDFRGLAEQYMRERLPEQEAELEASLIAISELADRIAVLGDESQDAYFEQRAARRGIEAWAPLVREAIQKRQENRADAYQSYLKADRIAAYVDGYLGKLLSLTMANGSSRYRDIAARSAENRRLALAAIIGAGALAIGFGALFASSISAPVRRLAEAADRMASGDLELEPIAVDTKDEVAVLARGFNAMSANIRALIEGIKEKAELERLLHEESLSRVTMGKALREAQFTNLQDHIRPHFLFNALNTIARSALFEEATETERLARSLAKLMRYSLSEGGSFVTIGEELATLREYLSFQGIRFGSRLAWEVRSDPRVESVLIPRFTLQPIVENAVRHGIEPKEEGGRVIASARLRGGRVRLLVADSGMGMDPALLRRIRESATHEASFGEASFAEASGAGSAQGPSARVGGGAGIGMANLQTRLAFRYPEGVRIAIASRRGRGTIVRITLPGEGDAA
ncbi:MAG TPA: histidine kinase [Rectinemataceae bacterium]|nr:histidine kinase [Rectinemataceae bacterium]